MAQILLSWSWKFKLVYWIHLNARKGSLFILKKLFQLRRYDRRWLTFRFAFHGWIVWNNGQGRMRRVNGTGLTGGDPWQPISLTSQLDSSLEWATWLSGPPDWADRLKAVASLLIQSRPPLIVSNSWLVSREHYDSSVGPLIKFKRLYQEVIRWSFHSTIDCMFLDKKLLFFFRGGRKLLLCMFKSSSFRFWYVYLW